MSAFIRVDNRLMHGQIIATWLPFLRARHVLVASDTVPENFLQISMFQMIVPPGTTFSALPVVEAGRWLHTHAHDKESTLVLLESLEDAVRLFECAPFTELNIGNVHHREGARSFTHAVYLSEAEQDQVRGLLRQGVRVEVRSLPTEAAIDLRRACGQR